MKFIITHYRKWLPWLMVIITLFFAYQILYSSEVKRSSRSDKVKKLRVVKVASIVKATVTPTWQASGVVMPSENVNVVAEVSGIVKHINPLAQPGALLDKGDSLADIAPIDYLLNLENQQAQLVQAQASFDLEKGERQLAKEELSYISDADKSSIEMALVLREPQFKSAQAKLVIAQVNVKKAEVALSRTKISMPFKGKVIKKNTGRGAKVGQNTALFSIVNVDAFWVEVKVPRAFLMLLNKNKTVLLSQEQLWGEGKVRHARIISVLPELDSRDRQAKVLLAIDDPLNINLSQSDNISPQVFINDFVNAELTGQSIENAWTIKSHWLQPDKSVWVVDAKKTMQKRYVKVLFKGRELVYVSGDFKTGDVAITEKQGVTAIGMKVKTKFSEQNTTSSPRSNQLSSLPEPNKQLKNKLKYKDKKKPKAALLQEQSQ